MSAQKTLSQLSFAIAALFIAAIPCFAQTESVTARADQLSASTYTTANQIAVANNLRRMGTRSESFVAEAEPSQKQPVFSATKFMPSVSEPASLGNTSSAPAPAMVVNFDTKPFEGEKPSSPKRITFAPSKGQRIPY